MKSYLYRSLTLAILDKGKIQTTRARAVAVQGRLDKLINWAKAGTLNARRLTIKALGTDKFFGKFAKSYPERKSGYSRIARLGPRLSDATEMVSLELLEEIKPEVKPEVLKEPKPLKKPKKLKSEHDKTS